MRERTVREKYAELVEEEGTALEAITDTVLDRGFGSSWEQLAPLSAGAVASCIVIVGALSVVRRLLGTRHGRVLGFLAGAALVPAGLWLLSRSNGPAGSERTADDGEAAPLQVKPETQETSEA